MAKNGRPNTHTHSHTGQTVADIEIRFAEFRMRVRDLIWQWHAAHAHKIDGE